MTKKTLIAVIASLGVGLLPLGLVALTGCGDNPTDATPFDAGSDAPRDGSGEGGGDGGGGGDAAKPDTSTGTDSGGGDSGSADAATDGG